jgi:recombination protein RecR
LTKFNLKITTISRGIPIGGEIEYADEITLGKSISSRINYKLEQ